MKKISIKPFLVDMMKQNFPDYELTSTVGKFYLFRCKDADGLYRYIEFQREGAPYNQLLITECGVGYNKNWDGHPSNLVGYGNSLASIMSNNKPTSKIGWVNYGDTQESIADAMNELKMQINTYIHPFLEKARNQTLRNDLIRSTKEVLEEELKKENQSELDEIKILMKEGMKANASKRIYNYPKYNKWNEMINLKANKPKEEYNRHILNYLKDYLNFYF